MVIINQNYHIQNMSSLLFCSGITLLFTTLYQNRPEDKSFIYC